MQAVVVFVRRKSSALMTTGRRLDGALRLRSSMAARPLLGGMGSGERRRAPSPAVVPARSAWQHMTASQERQSWFSPSSASTNANARLDGGIFRSFSSASSSGPSAGATSGSPAGEPGGKKRDPPGALPKSREVQSPSGSLGERRELQRRVSALKKAAKYVGAKSWQLGAWTWRVSKKTFSLLLALCRHPKIVNVWMADLKESTRDFFKWVGTGFRLFGANIRISTVLIKKAAQGHALTLRQRKLLVKTTGDVLKIIPFSFFIIIPFAELLLPVFLRVFPNMLPSTFFERSYDNATLSRKLKAKQEMSGFWQEVVERRMKQILQEEEHAQYDRAVELQKFQAKLEEGDEFPSAKEVLKFSKMFREEFKFANMRTEHLRVMCDVLGLQSRMLFHPHLVLQLRHHVTGLRQEDREILWEGIGLLSDEELVDACRARAIRFDVSKEEMQKQLRNWLELSSHKDINISLLLWCQSFFISKDGARLALPSEKVQEAAAPKEEEPAEAFSNMKQRRHMRLELAEESLEELRREIEIMKQKEKAKVDKAVESGSPADLETEARAADLAQVETLDEDLHAFSAVEVTKMGKEALFDHVHLLQEQRDAAMEVVRKQHNLLLKQMEFLSEIRQNEPKFKKDPDRILFDQHVRVVEMFNEFSADFKEVESEHNKVPGCTVTNWPTKVTASLDRLGQKQDPDSGADEDLDKSVIIEGFEEGGKKRTI